jgi:hypothetical protein
VNDKIIASGEGSDGTDKGQSFRSGFTAAVGNQATGLAPDEIPTSPLRGHSGLERAYWLGLIIVAGAAAYSVTNSLMSRVTDPFPDGLIFWPVFLAVLLVGVLLKLWLSGNCLLLLGSREVAYGTWWSRKKVGFEAIRAIQLLRILKVALPKNKREPASDLFEVNFVFGDPPVQRLPFTILKGREGAMNFAVSLSAILSVPVIEQIFVQPK